MTDALIRDVSDHALCVLAVAASSRGLSRSEFLRRVLENTARTAGATVTVADLEALSEALSEGFATRLAGGLAEGTAAGAAEGAAEGRKGTQTGEVREPRETQETPGLRREPGEACPG